MTFFWDISELIFGGETYIAEATNFRQQPQHHAAQFNCEKCKKQLEVRAISLKLNAWIVQSEIQLWKVQETISSQS